MLLDFDTWNLPYHDLSDAIGALSRFPQAHSRFYCLDFDTWLLEFASNGGPHGARTHDLIVANDALSQTELAAHVSEAGMMIMDVGEFFKATTSPIES